MSNGPSTLSAGTAHVPPRVAARDGIACSARHEKISTGAAVDDLDLRHLELAEAVVARCAERRAQLPRAQVGRPRVADDAAAVDAGPRARGR